MVNALFFEAYINFSLMYRADNIFLVLPIKDMINKDVELLLILFWSGLRDPIACSLFGGGIPNQNSGYKVTRLCPS